MNTTQSILLMLQAVVFAAWAILMFWTLFSLRARDADVNGGLFPSTGGFITQLKYWLKSDEDRRNRLILLLLTAALFALNLVNIVLIR